MFSKILSFIFFTISGCLAEECPDFELTAECEDNCLSDFENCIENCNDETCVTDCRRIAYICIDGYLLQIVKKY